MNNEIKKDMRGVFFTNQNKNKPTQPDFSGKALINGLGYRMAIWENKNSDNKSYFSVIFSNDEESVGKLQANGAPSNIKNSSNNSDDLDDILNITSGER